MMTLDPLESCLSLSFLFCLLLSFSVGRCQEGEEGEIRVEDTAPIARCLLHYISFGSYEMRHFLGGEQREREKGKDLLINTKDR